MKTSRTHPALRGFTLIELLVVIAIIAILAGLLLTAGAGIRNKMIKNRAQAELQQVALAINAYKSKLGYYPPDNINNFGRNQLYFELVGSSFDGSIYQTLDGLGKIQVDALGKIPNSIFGVSVPGIMNARRGNSDDGANVFAAITGLKSSQYATIPGLAPNVVPVLGVQLDGPGNLMIGNINPFRYNSSNPTNNPTSFDLWVDIIVAGKTNRISNWGQGITPL